ncbi:pre-rRNA processing protein [Grosmannia clavigera kw1407]|uniref:Pre-rRNA processing protein n=1 Tax=Grosmannia clavigera (strain kw1407 / UAMH 11150) TaxID=655863 RepID=F0X805_GROCL|nr:pre-rRNA processing protein [Grosmannia clavigera kw1407]EFX06206.1 pre-rRNA processing protein [Grosmannia clavigera kw1407]
MPSTLAEHSHKATTKVGHKPFKGGKGRNRKGKVLDERPKTPHQQVMSKLDRRNQNRQRQLEKQKEQRLDASIFTGRDGAPRNVAVIPLCSNCDAATTIRALNVSLDIEVDITDGAVRVPVERFKQQLQYIVVPSNRDVVACLDAARAADFVVFVISAVDEVDERGELILRSVESQGLTTLFTAVHGLSSVESAKQRTAVLESLKSFMRHFHPDQEKLFSLESRQECANLMRSLCNATPKGIHWRDERSWMLVEDVQFGTTGDDAAAVLTGVVRGKGLNADRLIHVGDWGSFQIDKITAAPISVRKPKGGATVEDMAVDGQEGGSEIVLAEPSEDRDDLDGLAPEEAVLDQDDEMEDEEINNRSLEAAGRKGVLLDDHHYFDDDEDQFRPAKKLPKGTSAYQSAWILDDVTSESGSDNDDEEEQMGDDGFKKAEPADGMEGLAHDAQTEGAGPSEYPQSEIYVEQNEEQEAEQLAQYRQQKRGEAEDDLEFPDEIELHPQVLARERLARYRGLKSLRSSPWNAKEDRPHEPEDWRRLLQIPDYKSSRIRAAREALVGGVAPGMRVSVHLAKGVIPEAVRAAYSTSRPAVAFSLLRHENKQTVVNLIINLSADHPHSIKAKEELIVQCGPRRFFVQPLFSQSGNTPNNVHKSCRFVHPGQSAVVSFVGPVTWGFVPTLFFKRTKSDTVPLQLAGIGTSLAPSTARVVAKRVVLTGHPYHIHKKVVTIRYMFFNREDVDWFKALPLWTKRGRSGYIKEALGTHGYFKATFDGRINPQDSIGVSLYKRVWPRKSLLYQEWAAPPAEEIVDEMMDEAME